MDTLTPEKQSLTKAVAVFIGWLSGSVGGIAAIFYVFGYLSSVAQLNLLGLSGLVHLEHEHYLEEGGRYLITVVAQTGEIVLNLLILVSVIALPVLLLLAGMSSFKLAWLKTKQDWVMSSLIAFNQRFPEFWRVIAFIVLLMALLVGTEDPRIFKAPLEVSGLLFNEAAHGKTAGLAQLLILGDTSKLNAIFANSLLMLLKEGLLLFLAWEVVSGWRARLLYMSPFIIIFLLYFLLLPMLYGVLQRQIHLPVVTLALTDTKSLGDQKKLYLLNKSDQEFVLWDANSKRVFWLPVSAVKSAEIRQVEPLFLHRDKERIAP
ncbi:MAG: hypothetical protein ABL885_09730 [Methylophilaceae bacterium]